MLDLFDRALRGDKSAHEEIDLTIRRISKAVCRSGGPGGADADWADVAQEASRYFFSIGIYRFRKRGSEESYLYAIVRTALLQIVRSAVRRRKREAAATERVPVRTPNPASSIDVYRILGKLSDECARLLRSVFLDGETYAVLASELNMLESSVRTKVSRCLRRARQFAEESGSA